GLFKLKSSELMDCLHILPHKIAIVSFTFFKKKGERKDIDLICCVHIFAAVTMAPTPSPITVPTIALTTFSPTTASPTTASPTTASPTFAPTFEPPYVYIAGDICSQDRCSCATKNPYSCTGQDIEKDFV
ncbi:surface antigen-like protein, partial [Reticulomyxa filosa]